MKKLEIIIRPDKLEELKNILNEYKVGGMTVTSVMGCGNQKGDITGTLKGLTVTNMNLLPKIQVNVVIDDDDISLEDLLNDIHERVSTGRVGDGKIFVCPIEEAVRIRTNERGKKAI